MSVERIQDALRNNAVKDQLQAFMDRPNSIPALVGAGYLALIGLPLVSGGFFTHVAMEAIILGLFAVSVNLALGYVGLLTLAPAAFFGLGAYAVAKIVVDFGGSYLMGIVAGPVLAAMLAVFVGYIPIKQRMKTTYFALFTLAIGVIAYEFTYTATHMTGGANGLGYVGYPDILWLNMGNSITQYYVILFVVSAILAGLFYLLRTDYRLVLHATRQNEQRMQYLGYDTEREQMITWILSCALSAFAGSLYVGAVGLAVPSMVSFNLTGEVLIWVIVGGIGTLIGPFIAAFVLTLFEAVLGGIWSQGYLIILGIMFIAFVFLLPHGIMGFINDLREQ